METKRILLVDDHIVVLKGLQLIVSEALGKETDIDLVTSGTEAIRMLRLQPYDLCILEIELPDVDGMRMLRTLRRDHPALRRIVHTRHEQLWYMREFIDADVDGVLFKNSDITEISRAVNQVLDGHKYYCMSARVLKAAVDTHTPPTMREMEILHLLAKGATTEEISRQLSISNNTTESHRRHLLEKFNARNVAELIINAVSQGFLHIPPKG